MKSFVLVIAILLLSGCASITRGSWDVLNIETVPPGATCNLTTGLVCASTPCALKMKRKSNGVVMCELEGYESGSANFTHKTAGGGAAGMAGNVLVGGLIGVAVDAGTGSTQDLTPNPVVIHLKSIE